MPSLKRRSDFLNLKESGQFIHITHWLAVSVQKNQRSSLRWAWTLSRKIGNSVTRNKLKRWGREFVRDFDDHELDINFIFKPKKEKEFYKKLSRQQFNNAFTKAFKKAE